MSRLHIRWTTNRRLAAAALGLGIAALAGNPHRGHAVRIDTRELAVIVSTEADHVAPVEVADWIVRGATDYRLIDLRDAAAYAAYHIPTAENAPLAALADHPLARNERIVLYSDGGIHAAQAWMLLRARGFTGVTTLRGGLDAWKDEVLFPVAPAAPAPQQAAAFERAAHVARFFGGTPRVAAAGGDGAGATAPLPDMAPPRVTPPPAGGIAPAPRKKKKEGC
jgi:rhodanese-related sulfurtransferase